jgi:hypothetical protein
MLSIVSPISLVIAVLAVWRVTHLFWGEDGPWDLFVRLRRLARDRFFGSLLDCFYCLSLWMAAPLAWLLGHTWLERGLLVLALSGGAILLERISAEHTEPEKTAWQSDVAPSVSRSLPGAPPPAFWHEEPLPADPRKES